MNLSRAACDKIEQALKHYLRYRPAFGRDGNEQMHIDAEHRVAINDALEELAAVRNSLNYGDLFGLVDLTPQLPDENAQLRQRIADLERQVAERTLPAQGEGEE